MPPPPYRRPLQAAALGLALILALFLSGLLSPRPAPRYTVTDLGVLPGYTTSSASAVNSRGEVAGSVSGTSSRAVLFRDGKLIDLGVLPGGTDSEASGMNSAGDVIGTVTLPTGRHAFLYSGGRIQDLGVPPGYTDSTGVGINDRGEVAVNATGGPTQAGTPQRHVFLCRAGGMTEIRLPPGCVEMHALGINNAVQIAGGCRWNARYVGPTGPILYDSRTQTMKVLPVPMSYLRGYISRINDAGEVVGVVDLSSGPLHAALWRGNRMTDLGAPPGYPMSVGRDLNNRGEAVGNCIEDGTIKTFLRDHASANNSLRRYLDSNTEHAFVYRGGKMQDLNELIPRDSDWTLENARGINDRGQIVGRGLHHGQERGFLLTPIR